MDIADLGEASTLLAAAATVVTAGVALLAFIRNNRIKAAETIVSLERDYSVHVKTLSELEDSTVYDTYYREALKAALANESMQKPKDRKRIAAVDGALRYFFVCERVRRLGIDSGTLDPLCRHYLRRFIQDDRADLREYMRKYWPSLFFWAPLASSPWPKRAVIVGSQALPRFRAWWAGGVLR